MPRGREEGDGGGEGIESPPPQPDAHDCMQSDGPRGAQQTCKFPRPGRQASELSHVSSQGVPGGIFTPVFTVYTCTGELSRSAIGARILKHFEMKARLKV